MFNVLVAAGMWIFRLIAPRLGLILGTFAFSTKVYQPIFDALEVKIKSSFSGLPADAYGFLQYVGVPNAISIIFAAITMRLAVNGVVAAFSAKGVKGA